MWALICLEVTAGAPCIQDGTLVLGMALVMDGMLVSETLIGVILSGDQDGVVTASVGIDLTGATAMLGVTEMALMMVITMEETTMETMNM